jgi:sigma-54 dependent transcriptional regulator, acetoin dehydrogenase operon transcriptional activator AcoR
MPEPLESRYYAVLLDTLDQGVFSVDGELRISSFNRAAELITGYAAEEGLGRPCAEILRSNLCSTVCPLRQSIQSRAAVRNRQVFLQARDGRSVPASISTAPLVTSEGVLLGGVESFRDLSQTVDWSRGVDAQYRLADIIGKSPVMRKIFDILPLVADSESTVLLTGASGTGKELVARTIHSLGPRQRGPFVAVNCAAIPETLLEAELFGHTKGAFTDAHRDRAGRIAAAESGTLLLDEIGDLPRPMQVKILRFLQGHEYTPLGSDECVRASVRVLAATNVDLLRLVEQGRFREDLYFRLNVVQIDIPPLRGRPEDIPLLVRHYVQLFQQRTSKPIDGLSEEAMACLMSYPFPGNVRELENIIERAFILCQGPRIEPEHFPPTLLRTPPRTNAGRDKAGQRAEAAALRSALARHGGNRTRAALELGIHRITLLRRLRRLAIA